MSRTLFVVFCIIILPAGQAFSAPPVLELPIQCVPGSTCFIQNYFDNDPSSDYRDYNCGRLSYDGHTGTDFRLRDRSAMRSKIAVRAAASGTVVGVRNNEPDISVNKRGKAALKGLDAGNGVRINHGDGWATQYSHLLSGSVRVRKGQQVKTGDVLGFVGLSGNTEFPHLDFSVSRDGTHVDPFNPERAVCGAKPQSLWSAATHAGLSYVATGVLISGFSPATPDRDRAQNGDYSSSTITADAESIVFWSEIFGAQKNDVIAISMTGPDGRTVTNRKETVPQNKAVLFSYVGKRRSAALWPKGTYHALLRLERNGKIVIEERQSIAVD
jgi:hypothetical protein